MRSNFSLSVKVVLISTVVISIAILMKLVAPIAIYFYLNQAPHLWTSFLSWLRPPYIYLLINCIIISIAASSRFHSKKQVQQEVTLLTSDVPVEDPGMEHVVESMPVVEAAYGGVIEEVKGGIVTEVGFEDKEVVLVNDIINIGEEEEESRSKWVPPPNRIDSSEKELLEAVVSYSLPEKPLVSSRFPHRKPLRLSPEGARALRVSKPKRNETLENTWKTITEGRAMPLTRHLKKSENFVRQVNVSDGNSAIVDPSNVKKSETFRDRTNYQLPPVGTSPSPPPPPSSVKLRKEPSLSQDELNRKVEAFIRKFNEEMRLQRQESLNQYKEMIGRGN